MLCCWNRKLWSLPCIFCSSLMDIDIMSGCSWKDLQEWMRIWTINWRLSFRCNIGVEIMGPGSVFVTVFVSIHILFSGQTLKPISLRLPPNELNMVRTWDNYFEVILCPKVESWTFQLPHTYFYPLSRQERHRLPPRHLMRNDRRWVNERHRMTVHQGTISFTSMVRLDY